MIVTPAQLLLAVAEHESLERTCAALGIELEAARKLLRGAAAKLAAEKAPKAAVERAEGVKAAGPQPPAPGSAATSGTKVVQVFSDGAARGNPGPAGAGAVVLDAQGHVLARRGRFLGNATNNVAEYKGLLLGLEAARELGARVVQVRADSQLLIRQLQGKYQVKHAGLKPLHAEALRLLNQFERHSLQHVPREENALADEMSNRAIDEEMR